MKNVATRISECIDVAIVTMMLILMAASIMGCGDTEAPLESATDLTENTAVGVLAQEKHSDVAPAAPTAPQTPGTPFVKAVGYYSDWKLTELITKPVAVGTTVFVKIVFSESMQHIVSDDKDARPILFYRRTGKDEPLVRFKMADHGAGGEDFISGDAKPLQSGTDDYLCKYKVVPEDAGKGIAIMVGRFSIDLEGNPLSAFYRHSMKLEVKSAAPASDPVPDDLPQQRAFPFDENPPLLHHPMLSPLLAEEPVTHGYYNGVVISDILPPSAWVLDFPGPYREHTPPRSGPRDFVGRVAMPVSGDDYDNWRSMGGIAPVSGVVVTITHGPRRNEQVITDAGGYYLFKNVVGNELNLRVERSYLELKDVIVSRSRPTTLQYMGANRVFIPQHHVQERTPGTILMGLRWPDAVRFILNSEMLPHDVLCIATLRPQFTPSRPGAYGGMQVTVVNSLDEEGRLSYALLAHELAHARQHAVAMQHGGDSTSHWKNTPESRAYKRAWEKDLKEPPIERRLDGDGNLLPNLYLLDSSTYLQTNMLENAAEFCAVYWMVGTGVDVYFDGDPVQGLRRRAPHRFRWAEEHLNTRYEF